MSPHHLAFADDEAAIAYDAAIAKMRPILRSDVMARRFRNGDTLEQIASAHGVCRERIRQLLKRDHGLTGKDGGQNVRAARNKAARMAMRDSRCRVKWGCDYAQLVALRAVGKTLEADGSTRERTPIGAFIRQRGNAARDGFGFEINLWQWWSLWQASGKWNERGRGRDGYIMARRDTSKPLSITNAVICPFRERAARQAT